MSTCSLAKCRALGPVAVSIVTSALSLACGSHARSTGPNGGEQAGTSKAAITTRGFGVNGCQLQATFDVTAPSAIDFVALDRSDLQSARIRLSTVDGEGRQTLVQRPAQQAGSSLQSVLDAATDDVDAAQTRAQQMTRRSTPASMLLASILPTTRFRAFAFELRESSVTSQQSNTTSSSNGANSQSITSSQSATSQNSQNTMHAWHSSGATAAQQANAASGSGQSSSSSFVVVTDLSQLDSTHMALVVDATASGANSLLRLFEGSNGVVTDVQDFPITAVSCGDGPNVNAGVPMVKPVVAPRQE